MSGQDSLEDKLRDSANLLGQIRLCYNKHIKEPGEHVAERKTELRGLIIKWLHDIDHLEERLIDYLASGNE